MLVEFERIAAYMGELCGAAQHDWSVASPEDVGMNGVPIRGWREAYFEGCKDMAEGIASRVPEGLQPSVREMAQAAFHKAFTEATRAHQQSQTEK